MNIRNTLCMTLLCLAPGLLAAADADTATLATEAAEEWLELLDDEKYGEAWDAGSTFLHTVIPREAYAEQLRAPRAALRLSGQKLASVQPRTSFADLGGIFLNLPAGEYFLIRYTVKARPARGNLRSRDISSSKAQDMVQTLVMVKEADNSWKLSFYMMSPGVLRPAN